MADIELDLDPNSPHFHDVKIVNGDLVLNDGVEAIRQHILQRLRMFLGEWFLDNTIGLPYFQQILVKNPDQSKIDAIFINQILGTPGVVSLTKYSFVPNFINRSVSVTFECLTTQGTVDYAGLL